MSAYVIFDVPPGGDLDAMKPYREKAFDTLIPYGGKVLVRTNEIDVREVRTDKGWQPTRLLIIRLLMPPALGMTRLSIRHFSQ